MPRRRARGEGGIKRRAFKRSDGTAYKRYYARITVSYDGARQSWQDGPMR